MNPFELLSLPLPEFIRIMTHENDKIRVCYAYIPKINFNEEQPKVSKNKVYFLKISKSTRVNPNLPMQELDFNDRIDTDEDNDIESINSSKRMDIIGQTSHKLNMSINDFDFDYISLGSHSDTYNNAKIEELDKIPTHIRSIKELLSNNEKLEYYLTNNAEIVIDVMINYELLEEDSSTLQSSDSLFSYENAGSIKWWTFNNKKDIINGMPNLTQAISSMEVENTKPLNKVIIKDANEESESKFEHLITSAEDHNIGMLPDKVKGVLTNDETTTGITK